MQAALLSLPSGAVGIIGIATASYSAYHFQTRSAAILGLLLFGFFGTALLTFLPDHEEAGRLVGVYLTNLIPTSKLKCFVKEARHMFSLTTICRCPDYILLGSSKLRRTYQEDNGERTHHDVVLPWKRLGALELHHAAGLLGG